MPTAVASTPGSAAYRPKIPLRNKKQPDRIEKEPNKDHCVGSNIDTSADIRNEEKNNQRLRNKLDKRANKRQQNQRRLAHQTISGTSDDAVVLSLTSSHDSSAASSSFSSSAGATKEKDRSQEVQTNKQGGGGKTVVFKQQEDDEEDVKKTKHSRSSSNNNKPSSKPASVGGLSNVIQSWFHVARRGKQIDPKEQAVVDNLSPIGHKVYETLQKRHAHHKLESWNVTESEVIGSAWNTPREAFQDNHDDVVVSGDLDDSSPPPTFDTAAAATQTTCLAQVHDEWLPRNMGDLIARTNHWCDILSLAPPDGLFLDHFRRGLEDLCRRRHFNNQKKTNDQKKSPPPIITIRIMFGNIVGTPIDCNWFIRELTQTLPSDAGQCLQLWVGSWRKGVSWNHSKIIAVDGKHLWTGGHNLWTHHYCRADPVHDISLELQGPVTVDAHLYANAQWDYIRRKQNNCWGHFVDQQVPDSYEVPRRARVTVSEFPIGRASEFPPNYETSTNSKAHKNASAHWRNIFSSAKKQGLVKKKSSSGSPETSSDSVDNNKVPSSVHNQKSSSATNNAKPDTSTSTKFPILSIGRYGVLEKHDRPADDALVAMLDAAQSSIRLAIQDLGPMKLPGTERPLPGTAWPSSYLMALAKAMVERNVRVEIVLSNPNSLPGHFPPGSGEFVYGNGWTCTDVAVEIILQAMRLARSRRHHRQLDDAKEKLKDDDDSSGDDAEPAQSVNNQKNTKKNNNNDSTKMKPKKIDWEKRIRKNLRISYLRGADGKTHYTCGQTIGVHAKYYCIDDTACYIGSQNLYDCDLAEWGVILDSHAKVETMRHEYWDPLWRASYTATDCPLDVAMTQAEASRPYYWLRRVQQACCRPSEEGVAQAQIGNKNLH